MTFPEIIRQPHLSLSRTHYQSLTEAQRTQLYEARERVPNPNDEAAPAAATSTSAANNQMQINAAMQAGFQAGLQANGSVPGSVMIDDQSLPSQAPSRPESAMRSMLANAGQQRRQANLSQVDEVIHDGAIYRRANTSRLTYRIKHGERQSETSDGSLVDGGANGGLCGGDMLVIEETGALCDVTGIAEQTVTNLKLVKACGKIHTMNGTIIGVFHQYANLGRGRTIHAPGQLRHMGHFVDDSSRFQGGCQCLITICGRIIPLLT